MSNSDESNAPKVKFVVQKAVTTNADSEPIDKPAPSQLTRLFQNDTENMTESAHSKGKSVTISLNPIGNEKANDINDENENATLTSGNIKNLELFDEYQERPLSKFLNNILTFDSVIPSSKEIDDKKEKSVQRVPQNKLGTVLGVFLPCLQNILGVILFIRSSWVVGVAGIFEASCIVLSCCACTLLTAISTSAIATNGIVPAGGPYFMISRSLGPEAGGAVGILFYLGNTVAASMYIVGAVEIFLKYLCPQATLIGDIEVQSDAFHNFRIYGTIFLIIIGFCVFIGIKFVSKLAPVSLVAVIISVIGIYIGAIKSAFDPPSIQICVFNQSRLIRYDSYMIDGISYCHNERYCVDRNNQTFDCPLWKAYCGKLEDDEHFSSANNISIVTSKRASSMTTTTTRKTTTFSKRSNISFITEDDQDDEHEIDDYEDLLKQKYRLLCNHFERENSVGLRPGIPGISSSRPLKENLGAKYPAEGEVTPGEQGLPEVEILGKEFTSFLILIGIYFPSVTGIMAGSNRSGDLKDASRSIPRGTISAVLTTTFIYFSSALLFGTCIDGLLLRDKFGDSINKKLVVGILAWPNKWVITIGAFLSTFGAGLQSLTSAPRLLQAVSKDEVIPFLRPLSASYRGEPFRALMVTLFLTWCGILLGNVDYLTPLIAMFFLMCYAFINTACALQTLLKAPSWRPRFKYYHWSLSLLGLAGCLTLMFIIRWYYAIVALCMALLIYKYIEYKGAEKEWGDGIRGLSMSAARFALLKLQESPPHVKNWRPQILLLTKCKVNKSGKVPRHQQVFAQLSEPEGNYEQTKEELEDQIEVEHPNAFAFVSQLKAGKGLFVCTSVLKGEFLKQRQEAQACKSALMKTMNKFKAKGFVDTLVSNSIEDGLSHFIQTEGLGGLRHNTIIINWPDKWNNDTAANSINKSTDSQNQDDDCINFTSFLQILRMANVNESAIIITKGIDSWPNNSRTDAQSSTIDLWWIIHDGGLLLLIVFLLKNHKIWQKCKLRLFTVAQAEENSIQIKKDLMQYMYFLRIDAEVDVIEMDEGEISAYTYEKTLKLHEREKILKQMRHKDAEIEPQNVLEKARRNSVFKNEESAHDEQNKPSRGSLSADVVKDQTQINNEYTFSPTHQTPLKRRTSIIQSEVIRKMHSAVELNKKILEKSKDASLVLMNIPSPPKSSSINADFNYMAYISASTEGLKRVLLVRGSGREVITIFS